MICEMLIPAVWIVADPRCMHGRYGMIPHLWVPIVPELLQSPTAPETWEQIDPEPIRSQTIPVTWERPDEGWIKINSDASVRSDGAAAGGLARDERGSIQFAICKPLQARCVVEAEAEAVMMCLSYAIHRGYKKIWLELDSKIVVDAINKWPSKSICCNDKIAEIRDLLFQLQWKCSHIYREGNAPADYLAKRGHDVLKMLKEKEVSRKELSMLAWRDAFGGPHYRRRRDMISFKK